MRSNKVPAALAFGVAAVIATGCGQAIGQPEKGAYNTGTAAYSATGESEDWTAGSEQDPNFDCPADTNVEPDYDRALDGSGLYKVCTSKTSSYQIKVYGRALADSSGKSDTVCVFPAQYFDSNGRYYPKIDKRGYPMYQCGKLGASEGGGGLLFDFQATNYNTVFIVPYSERNTMQMCLYMSNRAECPDYSFGKFR